MARHVIISSAAILTLFCGSAYAAKKETIKPYPHYWVSISTSNQSIPGMNEQMSGIASMFGAKSAFGPRLGLQLQLESPGKAPDKPEALHDIPAGMNMGKALPLLTPELKEVGEVPPGEREKPQKVEKPKARMLIYWGCGDTVRKGQPRIVDTEKMSMAEFGKALASRTPTLQYPPVVRSGWVYGDWPNKDDSKDIPKGATLVGQHLIHGNYVTDISFNIDQKHDFMAPVEFSSIKASPNGALKVEWKAILTATGYFATVMAHNPKTEETVFWSSSEVAEPGFALMNYLTNNDVQRFLKEKVLMPPGVTTCTLPPVFKDVAGALQFIAYGEEMNIVHPPKPKDPKKPWNPEWSVKVRLKSTGMTPLMEAQEQKESTRKAKSSRSDDDRNKENQGNEGGSSGGPMNKLKGLFGF